MSLRYIYMVTPHTQLASVSQINRSSTLVFVVTVNEHQHIRKSASVMDLYHIVTEIKEADEVKRRGE